MTVNKSVDRSEPIIIFCVNGVMRSIIPSSVRKNLAIGIFPSCTTDNSVGYGSYPNSRIQASLWVCFIPFTKELSPA